MQEKVLSNVKEVLSQYHKSEEQYNQWILRYQDREQTCQRKLDELQSELEIVNRGLESLREQNKKQDPPWYIRLFAWRWWKRHKEGIDQISNLAKQHEFVMWKLEDVKKEMDTGIEVQTRMISQGDILDELQQLDKQSQQQQKQLQQQQKQFQQQQEQKLELEMKLKELEEKLEAKNKEAKASVNTAAPQPTPAPKAAPKAVATPSVTPPSDVSLSSMKKMAKQATHRPKTMISPFPSTTVQPIISMSQYSNIEPSSVFPTPKSQRFCEQEDSSSRFNTMKTAFCSSASCFPWGSSQKRRDNSYVGFDFLNQQNLPFSWEKRD